jgi:hypothetical protein
VSSAIAGRESPIAGEQIGGGGAMADPNDCGRWALPSLQHHQRERPVLHHESDSRSAALVAISGLTVATRNPQFLPATSAVPAMCRSRRRDTFQWEVEMRNGTDRVEPYLFVPVTQWPFLASQLSIYSCPC